MPLSAWLLALLSAFLFALALNITQIGLRHIVPALGSLVSIPTAATVFWLTSPLTTDFSGWRNDAVLLFAAVGLFYPAAITILTFEATRRLGPQITAALGNLAPLYAVAAGLLLLGEQLGGLQIVGVLVLLAGVSAMTVRRGPTATSWPLWALALPIGASLLRGLGQPMLKIGFQWWNNPKVATLMCYLMSAMVTISTGLVRTRGTGARLEPAGVRWFMVVGLCNGIATWAGIEAVSRGPVALVAPVVATYPLFTLAIARMMSRSVPIRRQQAIGTAMTVAGVVMLLVG